MMGRAVTAFALLAAVLAACGSARGIDVANAYLLAVTPDQALALFTDDAVRVDVFGTEYVGKVRIWQQLTQAFSQRDKGEIVEPVHVVGDHVTWVNVNYDRASGEQYTVRSNIWVRDGKIARYTSNFTS